MITPQSSSLTASCPLQQVVINNGHMKYALRSERTRLFVQELAWTAAQELFRQQTAAFVQQKLPQCLSVAIHHA